MWKLIWYALTHKECPYCATDVHVAGHLCGVCGGEGVVPVGYKVEKDDE